MSFKKDLEAAKAGNACLVLYKRAKELHALRKKQRETKYEIRWLCLQQKINNKEKQYKEIEKYL